MYNIHIHWNIYTHVYTGISYVYTGIIYRTYTPVYTGIVQVLEINENGVNSLVKVSFHFQQPLHIHVCPPTQDPQVKNKKKQKKSEP